MNLKLAIAAATVAHNHQSQLPTEVPEVLYIENHYAGLPQLVPESPKRKPHISPYAKFDRFHSKRKKR